MLAQGTPTEYPILFERLNEVGSQDAKTPDFRATVCQNLLLNLKRGGRRRV